MIKKITKIFNLSLVFILLATQTSLAAFRVPSTSPYAFTVDEMNKRGYFENIEWENPRFKNNILYDEILEFAYVYYSTSPDRVISNVPESNFLNRKVVNERIRKAADILTYKKIMPQSPIIPIGKPVTIEQALPMIYNIFEINTAIKPRVWDFKDVSVNHQFSRVYNYSLNVGAYRSQTDTYFGIDRNIDRDEFLRAFYVFGTEANLFPKNPAFELRRPQTEENTNSQTVTIEIINERPEAQNALEIFNQVWNIITSNYLYRENVDFESITYEATKNLIESIEDPYTVFFTPEENQVFNNSLENKPFGGIGARVEKLKSGEIQIVTPLRGSPAQKAGVEPGDLIIAVNGTNITGMGLDAVVNMIKGDIGTRVKLTIKRGNNTIDYNITRETISIPTITWSYIKDGMYYIHLSQFTENSDDLFNETIDSIYNHANGERYGNNYNENGTVDGIIFDLRNNPGGYLEATLNIMSDIFNRDETLVQIKSGRNVVTEKNSNVNPRIKDIPMALLVNQGSASASEIMAGAFKDLNRGKVFGTKTFGKGTVQNILSFSNNSSLKVTTAEWLTPKGYEINKEGVFPDEVYDDVKYLDKLGSRDTPYQAAYGWLKAQYRRN